MVSKKEIYDLLIEKNIKDRYCIDFIFTHVEGCVNCPYDREIKTLEDSLNLKCCNSKIEKELEEYKIIKNNLEQW